MLAIGLFVFTLSALADLFQFGSSEGFGWKQGTGLILAAVLAMMGSLFGVLVLVVIGVVVGLLTLLADFFSFGSNPGFGVQQKLGSFVGAIILLLFGNRLPSLMRSLGQGIVEFKKGVKGIEDDHKPPPIEKPMEEPK